MRQILTASQRKELSLVGGLLEDVEWLGSASVVGMWGEKSMVSVIPAKMYEKTASEG